MLQEDCNFIPLCSSDVEKEGKKMCKYDLAFGFKKAAGWGVNFFTCTSAGVLNIFPDEEININSV